MKELTKTYGELLQDKRVRAEQSKHETILRKRSAIMARYKKAHDAFNDLQSGTEQAQAFYAEMGDSVDSVKRNVEAFMSNRRSEGGQLLQKIERERASGAASQDDRERERLRQMMDRLSTNEQRPAPAYAPPPPVSYFPPPPPPLPFSQSPLQQQQQQQQPPPPPSNDPWAGLSGWK